MSERRIGKQARSTGAVTRSDVARLAGVSTAVVSYVTNGGPRPVASRTRQRVERAIAVLGYKPNASARALRRGHTDTLGLVIADVENPFFAQFVGAIDSEVSARGLALFLANSHEDKNREAHLVEELMDRDVEGLIVFSSIWSNTHLAQMKPRVRTVLLDREYGFPGLVTVGPDFSGGATQAVRHLIEDGRKHVALVLGPLASETNARLLAWKSTLLDAGLPSDRVITTSWSRRGGYEAGKRLIAEGLPDGVFACSDMLAVGLLQALHEAGVHIPEDVAVVSFDGTVETEYTWPPLTTVVQPFQAMAHAAVAAILDGGAASPGHRVFPMGFVTRASCGPHAATA